MIDEKPDLSKASQQRQRALSRWDNEGGAGPLGPQSRGVKALAILTLRVRKIHIVAQK
jgi:hypothetical protein